jgi:hypothetical protein
MKGYRWCSTCRVGHPVDTDVCPDWLTALRTREAVLEQRRQEWRRANNRNQRWRNCIVCCRKFDTGKQPKRGRPQELCSAACQEIRDNDLRKLRHAGISSQRKRPKHGLRTRGVLRASPEVEAFLQAFPDGWSTAD